MDVPIQGNSAGAGIHGLISYIWYARGYFTIMIQKTRVPRTYFSLVARMESKAVDGSDGMIVPPPMASSTALKTDFTVNYITRRL